MPFLARQSGTCRHKTNNPLFPRPPVYAAYFAEATKAKKASSFAKASTIAGGYGGQDGGQDDRQAGPTHWLFQGPPAESKLLAVSSSNSVHFLLAIEFQGIEAGDGGGAGFMDFEQGLAGAGLQGFPPHVIVFPVHVSLRPATQARDLDVFDHIL